MVNTSKNLQTNHVPVQEPTKLPNHWLLWTKFSKLTKYIYEFNDLNKIDLKKGT